MYTDTQRRQLSIALHGIGLRLREIRKLFELTQPVMAAAIEVSDRAYKYYEQEKRELPAIVAVRISKRFKINLEWLLTGQGKIVKSDDPALIEQCGLAVLEEDKERKTELSNEKLAKIMGFISKQAVQTGETPKALADQYFDTL